MYAKVYTNVVSPIKFLERIRTSAYPSIDVNMKILNCLAFVVNILATLSCGSFGGQVASPVFGSNPHLRLEDVKTRPMLTVEAKTSSLIVSSGAQSFELVGRNGYRLSLLEITQLTGLDYLKRSRIRYQISDKDDLQLGHIWITVHLFPDRTSKVYIQADLEQVINESLLQMTPQFDDPNASRHFLGQEIFRKRELSVSHVDSQSVAYRFSTSAGDWFLGLAGELFCSSADATNQYDCDTYRLPDDQYTLDSIDLLHATNVGTYLINLSLRFTEQPGLGQDPPDFRYLVPQAFEHPVGRLVRNTNNPDFHANWLYPFYNILGQGTREGLEFQLYRDARAMVRLIESAWRISHIQSANGSWIYPFSQFLSDLYGIDGPFINDKTQSDMIRTLLSAQKYFPDDQLVAAAKLGGEVMLTSLRKVPYRNGHLLHAYAIPGSDELPRTEIPFNHSFLFLSGLLDLYFHTGDERFIREAQSLARGLDQVGLCLVTDVGEWNYGLEETLASVYVETFSNGNQVDYLRKRPQQYLYGQWLLFEQDYQVSDSVDEARLLFATQIDTINEMYFDSIIVKDSDENILFQSSCEDNEYVRNWSGGSINGGRQSTFVQSGNKSCQVGRQDIKGSSGIYLDRFAVDGGAKLIVQMWYFVPEALFRLIPGSPYQDLENASLTDSLTKLQVVSGETFPNLVAALDKNAKWAADPLQKWTNRCCNDFSSVGEIGLGYLPKLPSPIRHFTLIGLLISLQMKVIKMAVST